MRHEAILEQLGISSAAIAERGLCPCPEAEILEIAEIGSDGREHLLIPEAAAAWRRLKEAARQAGSSLFLVSAYRSVERQVQIIRRKLDAGQAIEDILRVSAPPGFSQHHSGRAVDLAVAGTPALEDGFDQTPAFAWLQRHSEEFGFLLFYPRNNPYGYRYEPWHWYYAEIQPRIAALVEGG